MTAQLVTFSQAGKLVGLSQDQIRKWVAEGKLEVKVERFPKRVDAADVREVFTAWERKPRAGKNWPTLRDIAAKCGVSVEGIAAAWKQKRRLAALGDIPQLGYDIRNAGRSKGWVICIAPVHAQRLVGAYTKRAGSPHGWIPSKDGKQPFPDRFPRMTRGQLTHARRKPERRLMEAIEVRTFTITTGGHVRNVLHFREEQIERLYAMLFDLPIASATNGHPVKPERPKQAQSAVSVAKPANHDRDAFATELAQKGLIWKIVIANTNREGNGKGWLPLRSKQAAILAVKRFAERNSITLRERRTGRPKKG